MPREGERFEREELFPDRPLRTPEIDTYSVGIDIPEAG
jgi:hypothetical protein